MKQKTRNTPITKDWFMLGLTTGMVSSVAKSFLNTAFLKAGFPTYQYDSVASGLVLGKRAKLWGLVPSQPSNIYESAIGHITDVLIGGVMGAELAYLYSKTPPGNEFFKGAVGGSLMWVINLAIGNQLKVDSLAKPDAKKMLTVLTTSVVFGGLQGLAIGHYGSKLIGQSHPLLVRSVSKKAFEKGRMSIENPSTDLQPRFQ